MKESYEINAQVLINTYILNRLRELGEFYGPPIEKSSDELKSRLQNEFGQRIEELLHFYKEFNKEF